MKKRISDEFIGDGIMSEELFYEDKVQDNMSPEEKIKIIEQKCKLFSEHGLMAHLSTARNGFKYFYNGHVLKCEGDYIIFDDRKVGMMVVNLKEIFDIQKMIGAKQ